MKKIIHSITVLSFIISSAQAKQVSPTTAQLVARNFISQNAKMKQGDIQLVYTEKAVSGLADYYVFNIDNNAGFIIISAEDAGIPVIGYSTESGYEIPTAASSPEFNFW